MPFATTWRELESIILSEIRHLDKEKYNVISLIGWNFRNETNGQRKKRNKPKNTDSQIEQTGGHRRGGGVGQSRGEVGDGDKEHTYLEHRAIYGSVESLCCTPETRTTLYVDSTGIKIRLKINALRT